MTAHSAYLRDPDASERASLSAGDLSDICWHALTAEETMKRLNTSHDGLHQDEVERRLSAFGPNTLPGAAKQSAVKRLLLQFHNLLIYVLIASALLSISLGHMVDAAVILIVVVLNAAIGFVQEGRAEAALEAIRGMAAPHASIRRAGRRETVGADRIVPGDVVLLEAGFGFPPTCGWSVQATSRSTKRF